MIQFKKVLCYGDSNTYGLKNGGGTRERYARDERWPGILRNALGSRWEIIEEGLCGRTTDRDDPVKGEIKNGRRFLNVSLETHNPFDFIILFLGTNDLKECYGKTASDVGHSIRSLMVEIDQFIRQKNLSANILLVSPPRVRSKPGYCMEKFIGAQEKSENLSAIYSGVASQFGAQFIDLAPFSDTSTTDGVHIDLESHAQIGKKIAELLLRAVQPQKDE